MSGMTSDKFPLHHSYISKNESTNPEQASQTAAEAKSKQNKWKIRWDLFAK